MVERGHSSLNQIRHYILSFGNVQVQRGGGGMLAKHLTPNSYLDQKKIEKRKRKKKSVDSQCNESCKSSTKLVSICLWFWKFCKGSSISSSKTKQKQDQLSVHKLFNLSEFMNIYEVARKKKLKTPRHEPRYLWLTYMNKNFIYVVYLFI